MIRFITNHHDFEKHLSQVLEVEIDYLTRNDGILYLKDEDKSILQTLLKHLETDNIKVTCLECYGVDDLTFQGLLLAQKWFPQQLTRLSKVLMKALSNDDPIIKELVLKFKNQLDFKWLEFIQAFLDNHGHVTHTSFQLFMHRNTVNNRLNIFLNKYGIDLRIPEDRACMDIILNGFG